MQVAQKIQIVLMGSVLVLLLLLSGCGTVKKATDGGSSGGGGGSAPVKTYTVIYDASGATGNVPVDANKYKQGATVTVNGNTGILTKSGYNFLGWAAMPTANSAADIVGPTFIMGTADVVLYAQWGINQYTLSFDSQEGSAIDPQIINYGETATQPSNPTRAGYSFSGWYTTTTSATAWDFSTDVVTETKTLYARWSGNAYSISFDSNGGSAVNTISQDFGTVVTAPANPTKVGYTFVGWSPALPATMPVAGSNHTATWTVNSYTISFASNGGSAVNSITQAFGAAVTAPADPTKAGYTFAGWSPALPATMPVGGSTYTAQWTANLYTITFDANGGTGGTSITVAYGAIPTAPTVIKKGYTFTGWSPAIASVTGPVTYTAQWIVKTNYDIGDIGPSGVGIVFYVTDGGMHGLEAAPADLPSQYPWKKSTTSTAGTSATAIGTGAANTAAMAGTEHTAAQMVRAYAGGGKTDWFIPSKDELYQLYLQKNIVGGFVVAQDSYPQYWSSSEGNSVSAWYRSFYNGSETYFLKTNYTHVRPVRAF